MSITTKVWIVILLGSVVTFSIRASFVFFADRVAAVPDTVRDALRMVPAAALSALVAPALLRPGGDFTPFGPSAIAGVIAIVVAWRTRNLLATIAVGLAAIVALEALLG